MSDHHLIAEHIARTVNSLHGCIDDLTLHIAKIGEHDARDLDEARFRLEQLSQKLRFKTLQAAE